jgi:hypothetical protein
MNDKLLLKYNFMSQVVSKDIVRLKTMVLHLALPPLLPRSVISYPSNFLLGARIPVHRSSSLDPGVGGGRRVLTR